MTRERPWIAERAAGRLHTAAEPPSSLFDATTRLAVRVLNGEVVFFVGSGFSLDSERTSTARFVGRLLAGVLAMCTVLADENGNRGSDARRLLGLLGRIFSLKDAEGKAGEPLKPARCMTKDNIALLAREYYNFNEWSVSALGVLSQELLGIDASRRDDVATRIKELANLLLTFVGDSVPLDCIDCDVLRGFASDADRGKALFLDIMGFASETVMAGRPHETDVEAVARSYEDRLRPRHHALARIAREGLARALVTTNYDLLLEGAYRLTGFVEHETLIDEEDELPSGVPRFSCIGGAEQFFARGEGYRTALLLKIHGSVEIYRESRSARIQAIKSAARASRRRRSADDPWAAYLPAMVFTYREIQTWRTDAWSRDLIRTLLRTHTLALCGYSAADPVMHSTFREVYDERAGARRARTGVRERKTAAADAPMFFFGIADRREFYSLEILRAASDASSRAERKLLEHPNHIEFQLGEGFPTIDDHFRWIVHCVVRNLQLQALTSQLRRLSPKLLNHPCPDEDFKALRDALKAQFVKDRFAVARCADPNRDELPGVRRREFDDIVGWTWHFVPGVLRELALAELVESRQGRVRRFA